MRDGVDPLLLGHRDRVPEEPFVRAVLATIPVLEGEHVGAGGEATGLGEGRLAVVGMDEVHERLGEQLLDGEPQGARPGGVEALEVAVEPGDAEHVDREPEETILLLLDATARGVVPDDAGEEAAAVRLDRAEAHLREHLAAVATTARRTRARRRGAPGPSVESQRQQDRGGLAEELLAGVAEHRLDGRVDEHDPALAVEEHEAGPRGVHAPPCAWSMDSTTVPSRSGASSGRSGGVLVHAMVSLTRLGGTVGVRGPPHRSRVRDRARPGDH